MKNKKMSFILMLTLATTLLSGLYDDEKPPSLLGDGPVESIVNI